jgi:SAM-dependent methyltransferase
MPDQKNTMDWSLLDRAAEAVRSRVTPESRFCVLVAAKRNEMGFSLSDGESMSLPCTERLSKRGEPGQPQVGDMPPQPPTLRAHVGAVLVKIVQRMLFWYTEQIRTFHKGNSEAAGEQVQAFQKAYTEQRRQRVALSEVLERLVAIERRLNLNQELALGRLDTLTNQLNGLTKQISSFESRLVVNEQHLGKLEQDRDAFERSTEEDHLQRDSILNRLSQMEQTLALAQQAQLSLENTERQHRESLVDRLNQTEQNLAALGQAHTSSKGVTREMQQRLHEAKTHLLQQELRLKLLILEARKHPPVQDDTMARPAVAEAILHINDPLFVDHARTFRGTLADIQSRLAVYVPYARDAFVAAEGASALDLGCGRGEWLEVLKAAGIPASGIDLNGDLVLGCQQRGLDVSEGDILKILRSFPDQSRSVITAFHVLEHISFQDLLEVVDQAVRVLKPGGVAIFETPNPKNLFVSSNNFYFDPTHRHPLPSELLAFVIEARGLCDPKVIPLSPFPDYLHLEESDCPAVRFINEHFYGPQDYGIVARKA